MLVGNNELITAPVRDINAKVEALFASTDAKTGRAVRIDGCVPGSALNIQLHCEAEIYGSAEIAVTGKNLLDTNTYELTANYILANGTSTGSSGYKAIIDFIPCSHLQGQTITLNHPVAEKSTTTNARAFAFYTAANASAVISGTATRNGTVTVPATATHMRITVPSDYNIEDLQIELGDKPTTLEEYKEPQTVTPSSDGTVSLTVKYDTTTIYITNYGESEDMILTASYSFDNQEEFRCVDRLKSITLERAGTNKFFGFGIAQKANIKLIDIERNYNFTTENKFNIYFDGVRVSPRMRVSEVHRDENTNELSITTYDVLNDAPAYTIAEVELPTSYTIGELAAAVAQKIGVSVVIPELAEFNLDYIAKKDETETPIGNIANFDGAETLREVLDAIAEATQTVYFMNANNELVFTRLQIEGTPAYTIDREQYITLKNKDNRRLKSVCSATELGENYETPVEISGTVQYVRNNPFWELREDVENLVDNAVELLSGMTIGQFDCSWRGNYLVEPGDKIALTTKDGSHIYSYLVNDTITYNGSYSQHTTWEYTDEETEHANPTNLGEALKQTYAKVDKANKDIELVVSENAENKENISQLQMDTGSISALVANVESALVDATDGINQELATITEKVNATMTSEEILFEISTAIDNGVESVQTGKGFSFNDDGLTIEDLENPEIITQITNNGMGVYKGSISENNRVLTANDRGVKAKDLHATTYLIIGDYSRLENYGTQKRTACFWIGG